LNGILQSEYIIRRKVFESSHHLYLRSNHPRQPWFPNIERTSFHGTDLQRPKGPRKEEFAVNQAPETYSAGILDASDYGALSGFSEDASSASKAEWPAQIPPHRQKRVIIVGAGVSGIQQATVLLRDGHLSLEDIQMFDALDNYGGVWNKNNYPGCACDVPAMIYTTTYHVNKSMFKSSSGLIFAKWRIEWTNFFATQPQIESYYTEFAKTYGLQRCTQFQSLVQSCVWDETQLKWRVQVQNKVTGEVQYWLGDYICQCVGALDRPKFGTTPGRE
jgi:hypothetical protein